MIDIQPNFAAVKQGLIPLTPQEKMKLDKDGLEVIHDIYRYAKTGFASIDPDVASVPYQEVFGAFGLPF